MSIIIIISIIIVIIMIIIVLCYLLHLSWQAARPGSQAEPSRAAPSQSS